MDGFKPRPDFFVHIDDPDAAIDLAANDLIAVEAATSAEAGRVVIGQLGERIVCRRVQASQPNGEALLAGRRRGPRDARPARNRALRARRNSEVVSRHCMGTLPKRFLEPRRVGEQQQFEQRPPSIRSRRGPQGKESRNQSALTKR